MHFKHSGNEIVDAFIVSGGKDTCHQNNGFKFYCHAVSHTLVYKNTPYGLWL